MSFADEVDALRAERRAEAARVVESQAAQDRREASSRALFDDSVAELWRAVEQYWQDNAKMVVAGAAEFIRTGRWDDRIGKREPMSFPKVRVFSRPRSAEEQAAGDDVPSEDIEGLDIRGQFALCAPGVLMELKVGWRPDQVASLLTSSAREKREIIERLGKANERSYRQVPLREAWPPADEENPEFGMVFVAPAGGTDAALRIDPSGAVVVFSRSENGWELDSTLRQLVASAMATMPGLKSSDFD